MKWFDSRMGYGFVVDAEGRDVFLHRRVLRPQPRAVGPERGLLLGIEGFVAHGVPAGVGLAEDVAVVGAGHAAPDLLRGAVVPGLRGADEVVVGEAERRGQLPEPLRVAVGQRAGGKALLLRRLLHLEAVLVGAGQEVDILPVQPLEARDGVGRDRLVGMAEVRRAVGIGNGRGDVELLLPAHGGRFRSFG